jgi:D-alanyl-D-alanine carboxypeptidase/D-alanyl-D-alanine-endopeptidase (penicillin-binding protein 4)
VFFGHVLSRALAERGCPVNGGVVRRRLTPAAAAGVKPLAVHETPLPEVLWRCNTFSQNLFAECLVKSLDAYNPDGSRSGRPGSWEGGHDVLRAELGRLGVDLATAQLRDGSGLSHQNRVTASQVVQLLRAMRRHPHAAAFLDSLARAGEEGSMKRRFADPVLKGRVLAKTGTLNHVSSLAGYATRADGTVLAFALLVNGDGGEQLAVDVCRILVQAGR